MSEHIHINLSSLIPSAIILFSALSFTKYQNIFCLHVEAGPFAEKWKTIYWERWNLRLDEALPMIQSNSFRSINTSEKTETRKC